MSHMHCWSVGSRQWGGLCWGDRDTGPYGNSRYFPLSFSGNLKLLYKIKSINFFLKEQSTEGGTFVIDLVLEAW